MDKQAVIDDIAKGNRPKYKGVFNIIGQDENGDFLLLHKDDKDIEFAEPWKFEILDPSKITLSDISLKSSYNSTGGYMKNITHKVEGNKLILEIDLTQEVGKSKSKKNVVLASSSGNAKIEGTGTVLSLTLYKETI